MDPKKKKSLFITQIFLSPVHKMMVKGITRVRFHPLVTLNACTEWIQSLVVEMFWSRSTWWTQTRCSWSHDGIHPSLNYTAVSFGGSQDVRAETMWDRQSQVWHMETKTVHTFTPAGYSERPGDLNCTSLGCGMKLERLKEIVQKEQSRRVWTQNFT